MIRGWRHSDFASRVGEQVTLRALDGPGAGRDVPATLTACTDAAHRGDLVSYSITFLAGAGAPREQAMFALAMDGLDAGPVFLVPRRDVGDRLEYEGVFNQSVDKGGDS